MTRVRIPRRVLRVIEDSSLFALSIEDDGLGPEAVSFRRKVRQTRIVEKDLSILVELTDDEKIVAELLAPDSADGRAFVRSLGGST